MYGNTIHIYWHKVKAPCSLPKLITEYPVESGPECWSPCGGLFRSQQGKQQMLSVAIFVMKFVGDRIFASWYYSIFFLRQWGWTTSWFVCLIKSKLISEPCSHHGAHASLKLVIPLTHILKVGKRGIPHHDPRKRTSFTIRTK